MLEEHCWPDLHDRQTGPTEDLLGQCCRCCRESVMFLRLICDTVICEMLTNASKSPRSRAAAVAMTVASR